MSDEPPFEPGSDSAALFACPNCPKRFFSERSMQQHNRDKHAVNARNARREREESEARELFGLLGDDADAFDFDKYRDGEDTILRPALEKRGFTAVSFYMVEQDSFGPLIRGCRATGPDGKPVRFFYG